MSEKKDLSQPDALSRAKAYSDAGVDIHAGNELVNRIKQIVSATHTHGVLSDIGGFGGLYKPDISNMESPLLVASTDGVGTKLKLAFMFNKHDSIGIDLVAMNVNDVLVQGAKPLFFLDYFATGKLDIEVATQVVSGVAKGCKQAGCALLGGETAEMPDMYAEGEYDLAGFCVGMVDNPDLIDGSSVKAGDSIIGIASSGPHSNGYSLVRKIFAKSGLKGTDTFPGDTRTVQDVLLAPTHIYVECMKKIFSAFKVSGMSHITGGGFYDNIPRALPDQVCAEINFSSWEMQPVFEWLKKEGGLSWPEMLQIFNCGIGFVLIVEPSQTKDLLKSISTLGYKAWEIGSIKPRSSSEDEQVKINF